MLELSKKILHKVSFDKQLFKKELKKSLYWLNKKDGNSLKIWCLSAFSQYKSTIIDVSDRIY